MQHFHREVADYLAMRAKALQEVGKLAPNATAAEISAASDALARAVRRARPQRSQGTFFDPAAAAAIRGRLRDLLVRLPRVLEEIDDEDPRPRTPAVYARFPAASPMATMPPSLLAVLPAVPPELEYRLVGDDLILRDVNAGLVLDVVPKAARRR
jgi:hypothetical protein